jgi:chorismate synthase
MSNSFGAAFRVTTFGESHGGGLGVIVDGCPAGHPFPFARIAAQLARRRPGQSKLTSPRQEADELKVLSGLEPGTDLTLGTPIAMLFANSDARSHHYDDIAELYRPSHADYTYDARYGLRAVAGGGRSSARETVARVAAGRWPRTCWRPCTASRSSPGSPRSPTWSRRCPTSPPSIARWSTPARCAAPTPRPRPR